MARTNGRYVREQLAVIESQFYQIVRRGQIEGEIASALDPKALARLFTATAEGMAPLARGDFGKSALQDVARLALLALGAQPQELSSGKAA